MMNQIFKNFGFSFVSYRHRFFTLYLKFLDFLFNLITHRWSNILVSCIKINFPKFDPKKQTHFGYSATNEIINGTNPFRRCDHALTTISESSGSQGNLLLALSVGTGDRSETVGYLGPPEADFLESRQIAYLTPEKPKF